MAMFTNSGCQVTIGQPFPLSESLPTGSERALRIPETHTVAEVKRPWPGEISVGTVLSVRQSIGRSSAHPSDVMVTPTIPARSMAIAIT